MKLMILAFALGVACLTLPSLRLPPRVVAKIETSHYRDVDGHGRWVSLQSFGRLGPSDSDGKSELIVLENDKPLGPAHESHDEIRTAGNGRYSHWGESVFLSASDNTDPQANGRVYSLRLRTTLLRSAIRIVTGGERFELARTIATGLSWLGIASIVGAGVLAAFHATSAAQALSEDSAGSLMRPWVRIALIGGAVLLAVLPVLRYSASKPTPIPASAIVPDGKVAFAIDLQRLGTFGPSDQNGGTSEVVLLENGEPIGVGHQTHDSIRGLGAGRYSHWGEQVVFSTPDNSDPRTNGRTYALQEPMRLAVFARKLGAKGAAALEWGLPVCSFLMLLLAISPWTFLPGSTRRAWLRSQTVPTLGLFVVLAAVATLYYVNALNVASLSGRAIYAAIALLLPLVLTFTLFAQWRAARRLGLENGLSWHVRSARGTVNMLLALAACLLVVEGAARAMPVHDSFAINPGIRHFWPEWFLAQNELGYCEHPIGDKKGPRVLAIGDSFTEGAGVSREQRYSACLQRLLAKSTPDVEVICAGRCGFDTHDEADMLEKTGDVVRPDVVVVGYVLNDAEGDAPPSHAAPTMLQRICLGTLQSYAYYRVERMNLLGGTAGGGPGMYKTLAEQHADDSPGWKRVERGMDRIATWCDARGVRRILVVFPMFGPGADAGRETMNKVEAAARKRGFETRNMLDDFNGEWGRLGLSRFDIHPGAEAHVIIARVVGEMIGEPRPAYRLR